MSGPIDLFWQEIIAHPLSSLAVIGNLIVIETLLSVDNAAVLATVVMDLHAKERSKALSYGVIGAYLFRGIALIAATALIKIWFLKPLGGLYLCYLAWNWLSEKFWPVQEEAAAKHAAGEAEKPEKKKEENWLYRLTIGRFGQFWATVLLVEIMDLTFAIDNVFAAVAFSKNLLLILTGVFIGILAMRFVSQQFVKLMEKNAHLETSAFVVIGILGVKLCLSVISHFFPNDPIAAIIDSKTADWLTSALTLIVFLTPLAFRLVSGAFYTKER